MKKLRYLRLVFIMFLATAMFVGCAAKKSGVSLNDMKELSKNHALVVAYDDGTVKTYDDNGIKPLFRHLESGDFKNSYVFDKVTGRASAFILAYGKASKLYTGILSKEAVVVLEQYNIEYSADTIVDYIVNRSGDDKCPMEKSVTEINDPEQAYKVLKEKFGK